MPARVEMAVDAGPRPTGEQRGAFNVMARAGSSSAPNVTSPPRLGRPHWTAYTSIEGDYEPLDPLRLDMYAQRLGNVLVPGVTARTQRARYLGMVCAGLRQTYTPGQTVKDRRRAFLPFERGWALAVTIAANGNIKHRPEGATRSRLKPAYEGFRGANRVLAHYRTVSEDKHVAPAAYKLLSAQESQGGLGAYLVTLAEFNLVHRESLDLTPSGRELAEAFKSSTDRRLRDLVDDSPVSRSTLQKAGHDLTLAHMSAEERRLCRSLLFDGVSAMAEIVRRMRQATRERLPASEPGLRAIADSRGDELAQAAHYAVCFDPFRRVLGELFARLGSSLEGRPGAHRLADLADDDLEEAGDAARASAKTLASCPEIQGMEPIATVAREIAAGATLADTVRSTIEFHRNEGRGWILDQGDDRYTAGQHGAFVAPSSAFHGYTVGSAMRMLRDIEATS